MWRSIAQAGLSDGKRSGDFDCRGWGYRAYDLAVFPWAFAITESATEYIEAMGRAFRSRHPTGTETIEG